DYVDGTFTEPSPASSFKSMFSVVSELRDVQSQASEDYQKALTLTIDKAMAEAVASAPADPDPTLSRVDRIANYSASAFNKYSLPGMLGLPMFNETGPLRDKAEFNPSDYITFSATPLGNGILQIHRMPRSTSPTMRPVTVTITAEKVVQELDEIY